MYSDRLREGERILGVRHHVGFQSNHGETLVLIDIWATWCGPCKKEMPGYQELADKYGPTSTG